MKSEFIPLVNHTKISCKLDIFLHIKLHLESLIFALIENFTLSCGYFIRQLRVSSCGDFIEFRSDDVVRLSDVLYNLCSSTYFDYSTLAPVRSDVQHSAMVEAPLLIHFKMQHEYNMNLLCFQFVGTN